MILAMVLPKHLQPIRIANALEYTAYQMGQINRKLDKLIAAVELMAKQAWDADKPTLNLDLVLADIAMPETSGVGLAKAIEATRSALPVILMTGYGDGEILKERGEMPVLQKPSNEADLAAKIGAVLKR